MTERVENLVTHAVSWNKEKLRVCIAVKRKTSEILAVLQILPRDKKKTCQQIVFLEKLYS